MGRSNRGRKSHQNAAVPTATIATPATPVSEDIPKENVQAFGLSASSEEGALDNVLDLLRKNGVEVLKVAQGEAFFFSHEKEEADHLASLVAEAAGRKKTTFRPTGRPPHATEIDGLLLVRRSPEVRPDLYFPSRKLCFLVETSTQPLQNWTDPEYFPVLGRVLEEVSELSKKAFLAFLTYLDEKGRITTDPSGADDGEGRSLIAALPLDTIEGHRVLIEHTMSNNIKFKLGQLEKKLLFLGVRELVKTGVSVKDITTVEQIREAGKSAASLIILSTTGFKDLAGAYQNIREAHRSQIKANFPVLSHYLRRERIVVMVAPTLYATLRDRIGALEDRVTEGFQRMEQRMDRMEQRMERMEHYFTEILARLTPLEHQFSEILNRLPPSPPRKKRRRSSDKIEPI